MTPNLPRLRAWCDSLAGGHYRQTTMRLVEADPATGRLSWCAEGVAAHLAWADGAELALASDVFTGDVDYRHPGLDTFVTPVASEWLGWDVAGERVDLTRCPGALRARINRVVTARLTPRLEELAVARGCDADRWEVWALNDLGVPFVDIAAALRCHLGVDLDLVPDAERAADYTLVGAA